MSTSPVTKAKETIYLDAELVTHVEEFAKQYAVSEDRSELIAGLLKAAMAEVRRGSAFQQAFLWAVVSKALAKAEAEKRLKANP
jgi:hypothetical protein